MAATKSTRKSTVSRAKKASPRTRKSSKSSVKVPFIDNRMTLRSFFRKVGESPATLYVGGGLAAALAARFGYKFFKSHPEIKEFIKDNIETVEDKIREYRSDIQDEVEARH